MRDSSSCHDIEITRVRIKIGPTGALPLSEMPPWISMAFL